jgi:hypothetical protein
MYTRKKLPKSQYELSKGVEKKDITRATDVRRDEDTLKELTVGLFDLDNAIKYYFENVIKPEVVEFGTKVKVPVMYGSPERWKNVQADGYFRDKNGKILSPIIAYKRTAVTKNRTLSNKIDANFPQLYYTQELKYSQQNKYDQFSILTNSKPIKTFVNTVIPDFVDITYDVIIWTDFVESMNTIVESILYSEGSYWGDMEKFKFRTKIDSFTNTTDLLQDADRIVRTTFQLTLFGQIIPDTLNKNLSQKESNIAFDTRQVVMETTVDADPTVFQQIEEMQAGRAELTTPLVRTALNPASLADATVVAYLNTNKAVAATSITVPNLVYFSAAFLAAPTGLPATSASNFTFFINGQYVEPSAITSFVESGGGICTLTLDVGQLGFTLILTDEIVAIGKFA